MKKQFMIVIAGVAIIIILAVVILLGRKQDAQANFRKGYLKEADTAFLNGDLVHARKLYGQAQEKINDTAQLKEIQRKIEDINIKIIFSPVTDKCAKKYVVKPNDSLLKIAKENNTTIDLIKRANNLSSDIIRPEQELKVNTCRFSIVVDKSQNLLFLKVGDEIVKTYVVSTGKNNSTPVGVFKIVNKQPNPTWFRAGAVVPPESPDNILGTKWLGLEAKVMEYGTTRRISVSRLRWAA